MNKIGVNEGCPCGSGLKFKKCHRNKIYSLKAKNFTVCVNQNNQINKLFKITFHNTIGTDKASIIISFPYHKNSKGLLSRVTFPGNTTKVKKLSLIKGGQVTSHKIKFSYWKDGNVHFSQDGKIFTFKKCTSDVLDKAIGHIFTINIKGVTGFEKKEISETPKNKDVFIQINIPEGEDDSIKFTGWWYDYSTCHPQGDEFSRMYKFKQDDGPENCCFALQPPAGSPISDKVLFLCFRKEFMTKEKGTHLLFIGGFDPKELTRDIGKEINFLAMKYPARNYEKLKTQIGSVDLPVNIKL